MPEPMSLDTARYVLASLARHPEHDHRPERLAAAASLVIAKLDDRERDVERLRTRLRVVTQATRSDSVIGFPLIEGRSGGGPRHYLNDRPVHAGDPMYLLTWIGWMPGRYEWNYTPGALGLFYFTMPGCDDHVSIPISPDARLAWTIDV